MQYIIPILLLPMRICSNILDGTFVFVREKAGIIALNPAVIAVRLQIVILTVCDLVDLSLPQLRRSRTDTAADDSTRRRQSWSLNQFAKSVLTEIRTM